MEGGTKQRRDDRDEGMKGRDGRKRRMKERTRTMKG
jgi:hypothetical protein